MLDARSIGILMPELAVQHQAVQKLGIYEEIKDKVKIIRAVSSPRPSPRRRRDRHQQTNVIQPVAGSEFWSVAHELMEYAASALVFWRCPNNRRSDAFIKFMATGKCGAAAQGRHGTPAR